MLYFLQCFLLQIRQQECLGPEEKEKHDLFLCPQTPESHRAPDCKPVLMLRAPLRLPPPVPRRAAVSLTISQVPGQREALLGQTPRVSFGQTSTGQAPFRPRRTVRAQSRCPAAAPRAGGPSAKPRQRRPRVPPAAPALQGAAGQQRSARRLQVPGGLELLLGSPRKHPRPGHPPPPRLPTPQRPAPRPRCLCPSGVPGPARGGRPRRRSPPPARRRRAPARGCCPGRSQQPPRLPPPRTSLAITGSCGGGGGCGTPRRRSPRGPRPAPRPGLGRAAPRAQGRPAGCSRLPPPSQAGGQGGREGGGGGEERKTRRSGGGCPGRSRPPPDGQATARRLPVRLCGRLGAAGCAPFPGYDLATPTLPGCPLLSSS